MQAHKLDEERIAQLTGHVEKAIKLTGVPGVGLGIIQDSKVIFAGGFGVRELGKTEKVDGDTLFMAASNTKAMDWNLAVVHLRPAGGAWSSVNDMHKYIQMELNEGVLTDGEHYISRESLRQPRNLIIRVWRPRVHSMTCQPKRKQLNNLLRPIATMSWVKLLSS